MAGKTTCASDGPAGRLRVLMLGPTTPPTGGMAAVVNMLAASPLAERCELTVLNNGKTTPPGRALWRGVWAQARLFGRLVGAIVRGRAAVVHLHTCASPVAFWRDCVHVLAARLLGRRVVLHCHDGSFREFVKVQRGWRNWLMRAGFRRAHVALVLGEAYVREMGPYLPGARFAVVPNAVPIPPLPPPRSESGRPAFLFLGNLTRRKGAHDLVRATALAAGRGFAGVVRLAGEQRLPGERDELVDLIRQCGCEGRIELLGGVFGADKDRALAQADCLVLPSYAEGLSMAVLEAMSAGRAVIVTNVGVMGEVIADGREGFIISPGDVKALADRMLKLGSDVELRRHMGAAGRERAERAYSLDALVDRLMATYRGVLGDEGD